MNDPIHHITMYLNPLANEGLWTVDAHDRTDQINERGASILGHTAEEMMGRPTTDFLFPEDVDDELNWLKELRKEGRYLRTPPAA